MDQREHPENWIQTFTGRQFWPMEPDPGDVAIEDIAHALSMLCRYGGHSSRFFSVAEHSILVGEKVGIQGLIHDAAEAYLLDIPSPVKRLIPGYSVAEDRVQRVIHRALGVPPPRKEEEERLREADLRVMLNEKDVLHPVTRNWEVTRNGHRLEPYPSGVPIQCLPPAEAEAAFLAAWEKLRP